MIDVAGAQPPPVTPHDIDGINQVCGPFDADCRNTIREKLTDIDVHRIKVGEGITFGEKSATGAAVRFSYRFGEMNNESTDASLFAVEAAYLGEGALRVRVTLADAQAIFKCTGFDGKAIPYLAASIPLKRCKPEPGSARATYGFGGKLGQVQWDAISNRFSVRWAEIYRVVNLLGNANTESYLRKRLQFYAGADVDTVWYGKTPGHAQSWDVSPEAVFGIMGIYRTDNNHAELAWLAGARKNLVDIDDVTAEARVQALYHLLYRRDKMINVGLDTQYEFNSDPARSIGDWVSDRDRHTAYVGAVLGFEFR